MKTKVSKIIGVVLALATVMALGAGFIPSDTKTAEAAVGTLRFENIPLMKYPGAALGDGKYTVVAADATLADLGPIAVSPNGQTLYVASDNGSGNVTQLMKSSDAGYTWEIVTAFATLVGMVDTTPIMDIKISPLFATDSTLWVLTQNALYQSVDAGTNFVGVGPTLVGGETFTSLDVALDKTGRLSEIAGTANAFATGHVYVRSPATTGLGWVDQLIGATTRGVVAVAFSSKFANDEGIFAVTSSAGGTGNTTIQGAFGATRLGGGWDNAIGPGTFYFHNGDQISSAMASIAFPDDFDANSLSGNIAFVGLASGFHGVGPIAEECGDVFKVIFQPTRSSTVDLNVRGQIAALQLSATNIMSIDAMGPASGAKIVVGTDKWDTGVPNYYWTTYYSTDSGATWLSAREKSATGGSLGNATSPAAGANVQVAMSPADSNIVYASTNGNKTSAVSRSADGGKSFNQVSFIEYGGTDGNDATNFYSITSQAAASGGLVINMMTSTGNASATRNGAYWKTVDGGNKWERVWSYANPSVSDQLDRLSKTSDNATFIIDRTNNTIWRSTDDGVSFPRKITGPKAAAIAAYSMVDSNTIWVAYSGSPAELWYTTNLGLPWTQMDDNRVITGTLGPGIARTGTYMMLNAGARAFFSSDSGKTFKVLGVADPPTPAGIPGGGVAFDRNFATNKYVYANIGMVTNTAGVANPGGGIWRITVNVDDPATSSYRQIDNIANSGSGVSAGVNPGAGPAFHLAPDNYYVVDTAAVVAGVSGGLWRSVNPDADPDSIYPPRFNSVNTDLPAGYRVQYSSFIPAPTTIFYVKNNVKPQVGATVAGQQPAYFNQLFALADTLAVGPTLTAPADKATGFGIRLSTTGLTMTGTVTWTPQAGATQYWYQLADDAAFSAIRIDSNAGIPAGTTNPSGAVVDISNLLPNHVYYWRARAVMPFLSPWSATRSFTTSTTELIESVVSLEAPVNGATNVSLKPTLAWSRVIGATGYEWELAKDPVFAVPVERAGGDLAKVNAVVLQHELEYNTTYYWRVRAQLTPKPPTYSDWATGIFTTLAEPAATQPPIVIPTQAPPVVVEVPVPAAIPAYLLWAIVVIGAVLVIAVIVLIVRTRRVP